MKLMHGHLLEAEHFCVFPGLKSASCTILSKNLRIRLLHRIFSERMIGQEVKPHDTRQLVVHLST